MTTDLAEIIGIESAAEPISGRPICLLTWGKTVHAALSLKSVKATARELNMAAAAADTDQSLFEELESTQVGDINDRLRFVRAVRARRTALQAAPTTTLALRIEPIFGAATRKGIVTIHRGSMDGQMSPDMARTMAAQWMEAAVASAHDAHIRYALGDHDFTIEQVHAFMRSLRNFNDRSPDA